MELRMLENFRFTKMCYIVLKCDKMNFDDF